MNPIDLELCIAKHPTVPIAIYIGVYVLHHYITTSSSIYNWDKKNQLICGIPYYIVSSDPDHLRII